MARRRSCLARLWRELLDTAYFTTPEHIAGAITYGLQHSPYEGKRRSGYISTTEAREIMAFLETPEPALSDSIHQHFMSPSPVKSEKGTEKLGDQS